MKAFSEWDDLIGRTRELISLVDSGKVRSLACRPPRARL